MLAVALESIRAPKRSTPSRVDAELRAHLDESRAVLSGLQEAASTLSVDDGGARSDEQRADLERAAHIVKSVAQHADAWARELERAGASPLVSEALAVDLELRTLAEDLFDAFEIALGLTGEARPADEVFRELGL